MVYESRPGETFLLGASTWRIEDITHERVVVTPAPGQPGQDAVLARRRPRSPARAGPGPRRVRAHDPRRCPATRRSATLQDRHELDPLAAAQPARATSTSRPRPAAAWCPTTAPSWSSASATRSATGGSASTRRSAPRSTPRGPWPCRPGWPSAGASTSSCMWSDDGIVMRLPEAVDELPDRRAARSTPTRSTSSSSPSCPTRAMFAGRFRECAARALLLPRRRPDRRTPLWQQRQRAADLLAGGVPYPDFPILLETTRECLNDVFDLPALREVLTDLRTRRVRMVAGRHAAGLAVRPVAAVRLDRRLHVRGRRPAGRAPGRGAGPRPRPAARAARRRGAARAARPGRARRPRARAAAPHRRPPRPRRRRGPRPAAGARAAQPLGARGPRRHARRRDRSTVVGEWLDALVRERRAIVVGVAGEERFAAAEDAARLRDALGVAAARRACRPPSPIRCAEPLRRPGRPLRPHPRPVRHRPGGGPLRRRRRSGAAGARAARGRRPRGARRVPARRHRARVVRRRRAAPAPASFAGRAAPRGRAGRGARPWPGSCRRGRASARTRRGLDALVEAVGALQGAALPASVLEADVLAARVADYRPADLDALCTAGELVWVGAGTARQPATAGSACSSATRSGCWCAAARRRGPGRGRSAEPVAPPRCGPTCAERGASFWPDLVAAAPAAGLPYDDATVLAALWDLVWAGEVTNDSLAPLRRSWRPGGGARPPPGARRPPPGAGRGPSAGAPTSAGPSWARSPASGPPAAAGRWSLVAPLLEPRPTATEAAHATGAPAARALRRAHPGDGAGRGRRRRVRRRCTRCSRRWRSGARCGAATSSTGLGAAQFALPGAVDRLRAVRDGRRRRRRRTRGGRHPSCSPPPTRPSPTAPPCRGPSPPADRPGPPGPSWCWRPARPSPTSSGAAGRSSSFAAAEHHPGWAAAVAGIVGRAGGSGRSRLELARIDGEPAATSPHADALRRPASATATGASSSAGAERGRRHRARGRHHPPDRRPAAAGAGRPAARALRGPPIASPVAPAGHGRHRGRGAGQAPAGALRRRLDPPDPHAHDRQLAPLPARRAVAEARPPRPGRRRGRPGPSTGGPTGRSPTPAGWPSASAHRSSSSCGPPAPTTSAPTCAPPTPTSTRSCG